MSALRLLLALVLSGLLAATPVAAAVAPPAGPDAEAVEATESEYTAPARATAHQNAPAARPAAAAVPDPGPAARPSSVVPPPSAVRPHVLHCVWRE